MPPAVIGRRGPHEGPNLHIKLIEMPLRETFTQIPFGPVEKLDQRIGIAQRLFWVEAALLHPLEQLHPVTFRIPEVPLDG